MKVAVVGDCPICQQGLLVVALTHEVNPRYIIACSECESYWFNIDRISNPEDSENQRDMDYSFVTPEKLVGHEWFARIGFGLL